MDNQLLKYAQSRPNRLAQQMTHTQGYGQTFNPNNAFSNTAESFAHGIYNAPGNLARLVESMPDYQGAPQQYSAPIDAYLGTDYLNSEFTPKSGWQKTVSFAGEGLADPTMLAGAPVALAKTPMAIRNGLARLLEEGIHSPMVGQRGAIGVKELPMDEASRMQRAREMGMDVDLYHGTIADIDEFDPNLVDIGVHLGTKQQATNRLGDLYKTRRQQSTFGAARDFDEGANVIPLKANLGESIELQDAGDWMDSVQVLHALRGSPSMRHKIDDIENMIVDAEGYAEQYMYSDDLWRDAPKNRELLDDINQMLQSEGYQSVKYKNQVENDYGSLTDWTDQARSKRDYYEKSIGDIEKQVRSRMPEDSPPALGASEQDVLDWLNKKDAAKFDDYATAQELSDIDYLKGQLMDMHDHADNFVSPYSYIALNPNQLRSINATFDPSKKDSADLLASKLLPIPAGLLGLGLYEDNESY